jgi:anti-anti-sigma factor
VALVIDQEISGNVVILRARGRITVGEESDYLRQVITSLLNLGHKNILLNLQGVTSIDSAGLGTLVAAHTSVLARGGTMKLTNLQHVQAREELQEPRLFAIFNIAENEDEALGGDWPGPRVR